MEVCGRKDPLGQLGRVDKSTEKRRVRRSGVLWIERERERCGGERVQGNRSRKEFHLSIMEVMVCFAILTSLLTIVHHQHHASVNMVNERWRSVKIHAISSTGMIHFPLEAIS